MSRPVVLLTIGGISGIPSVQKELNTLETLLDPFHREGDLTLKLQGFANVTDVAANLESYAGTIELLHYAGHADGGGLDLDGQSAMAEGICNYFRGKTVPKVVFLNGCSTLGQVDDWLRIGVQAVIATATSINDDQAREFSETLYRHLSERATLGAAYQAARDQLSLSNVHLAQAPVTRAVFSSPSDDRPDQLPWGLYLNPETGNDGANYRLPWYQGQILTKVAKSNFQQEQATDNYYLLDVLTALAYHDISIPERVKKADHYESELFDILVESYPWTIGYHLSLLCKATDLRVRIELLTNTYLALGQTLHYVAISEWWWLLEHGHIREDSPPPPQAFHSEDQEIYPVINHWKRFLAWQQYLAKLPGGRGLPRVVPEFRQLAEKLESDADLMSARKLFSSLTSVAELDQLAADPASGEDAEYYLAALLRACSFLVNYQMLAVRNIGVDSKRGSPPSFSHALGKLYANGNSKLTLRGMTEDLEEFYYSRSVILTRREPALHGKPVFICLSPLIIDLYTYYATSPPEGQRSLRIFTFSFTDASGVHGFHTTNRPPFGGEPVTGDYVDTRMRSDEFEVRVQERAGGNRRRRPAGGGQPMLADVNTQMTYLRKDLGL
ncbi:CHAT domain-containing protein [Neolewinella persica]|uniref:CHAT domain-containing protein n=1 Tax=Neolewinella persica TaxID=70998 RepID=UPI00035C865F|nr:CHAT domain-containing protein [Neolewinella persica]